MAQILTRAELRDRCRRQYLGITPPVDSGGVIGAAPTYSPDPSNPVLNDCIDAAISTVNDAAKLTANTAVAVPVAATTLQWGPTEIDIKDLGDAGRNGLNDIKRCVWNDGTNPPWPMKATTFEKWDQQNASSLFGYGCTLDAMPPMQWPRWYYIAGNYKLFIFPSPTVGGTLQMYVGTSILSPLGDSDYIEGLPADYNVDICLGAAVMWYRSRTDDTNAQAKLTNYNPMWAGAVNKIVAWYNGQLQDFQASLTLMTNRRQHGLHKVRNGEGWGFPWGYGYGNIDSGDW